MGLAKSSPLGWAVLAAVFAALFAGAAALWANASWVSKAGGGLLGVLGLALGTVILTGGQFSQNDNRAAPSGSA